MQNRYAGDVGDYVKFALLRAIAPGEQLGINWYLYPDETHNQDGRHTAYLNAPEKWRHLDPALFDYMSETVLTNRSVSAFEQATNILPAIFSNALVYSGGLPASDRSRWRSEWFEAAQRELKHCSIVFADPDNGLVDDEPARRRQKRFGKQLPEHEAKELADGRTAVIYHHNTRYPGGHNLEVAHWRSKFGQQTLAVRANAYSCRTFFIINPTPEIARRASQFCAQWSNYRVTLDGPTSL